MAEGHGRRDAWGRVRLWVVLAAAAGLHAGSLRAGDWVLPDSRLGIRTAPILLLTRPEVQADLQLEPEQIASAQQTIAELTRRGMALRGRTGPEAIAERKAIDEAQFEWLGRHLSGDQIERLRQIELQWEGVAALLSRPTLAEQLQLSSDQRQLLARLITQRNARRLGGRSTPEEEQALFKSASVHLSPNQRELWGKLLGPPCRFRFTESPPRDEAAQPAAVVKERRP